VVTADSNEFKVARNDNVRIYARDSDAHRAITIKLSEVNLQYTHFCLPEDRALRVVVSILAASTPTEQIKTAFTSQGHSVENLYNLSTPLKQLHPKLQARMFVL